MKPRLIKALQETAGKIDFMSADLSFRRLREVATRIADLHEANAESTFGYLLKSAVHEFANNQYQNVPTIYQNFVAMVDSKRRSEVYGGLYRPNLPEQVDAGERFKDTSFKGFERELVNYKYGLIETFERELFDDDQTGQVRSRAANLGEGFKIFEEIYVLSRMMALAQTVEGVTVPASTYGGGSVFTVAIGNRPATYTLLSAAALEAAHVAMRTMTDPMGRKFLVTPTQLIVSVKEEFLAWTLVNSPAQANTGTSTTAAMVNPLQGRYTVHSSPFIKEYAWAIGEPKRGLVFQRRDPLEITQEQTQSGDSFRMEVYAFRARSRFECDWIEPRFLYMGNDGSVTS
jgi:phage major head subunit gpT-like protein